MATQSQLLRAGLLGASLLTASSAAFAGSCPAGKMVADGQGQKAGATMPKDVTDVVLGSIDLATQPVDVQDRAVPPAPARDQARRRGALAQPRRPPGADLRRRSGEVTEYASNCAVPIVHNAGEVAEESQGHRRIGGRTPARPRPCCSRPTSCTSSDDAHIM